VTGTLNQIALLAGFLVVAGYLLGSFVRVTISEADVPSPEASPQADNDATSSPIDQALLRAVMFEIGVAVLWASLTYLIADRVAPGTDRFRQFSAVGFLSPKALTIWESVSLWAGLSVVVGIVAPLRISHLTGRARGPYRGGSGLAAGGSLLVSFTPITFFIAVGTWFVMQRFAARRAAILSMLAMAVATEWLLSMTRLRPGWGFVHGPETVLWVLALAGVLTARVTQPDGDGN
jgi:hypothetical protein